MAGASVGAARRRRRPRFLAALVSPAALTLGLTAVLAVAGTALALAAPARPLLSTPGAFTLPLVAAALGAAFVGTELGQALIEVRSQAYSFSLSGVPLLLGLLYLPPQVLLPLRIGAAMAVFAIQRASALKFAYNSAAFLLDTALVVDLAHRLAGGPGPLSLRTAGLCYLTLAVVDVLMSSLVLLVIRINQGPLTVVEVAEVLVPAAFFVALNTAIALTCALLVTQGSLGALLVGVFGLLTALGYRAYLVLRRRHQSLQVVQDFIRRGEQAESTEQLCRELTEEIRQLVRASSLELTLFPDGTDRGDAEDHAGSTGFRLTTSEEDGVSFEGAAERPVDWLPQTTLRHGIGTLVSDRSKEPGQRQWLAEQRIHDALIVPLQGLRLRGVLVARERLGDATRFTADDLALLITLAGHFAVALKSRQLVERLQYEATHDALTGLPNRAFLTERMREVLLRPADGAFPTALLLDLNRFKEVNDALGHHIGDQLLRVVGDRLRALSLDHTTVARLGGDEFALFLPPSTAPEELAMGVAQSVREALAAPVHLPDVTLSTEACLGIAVAREGHSHTDLMRHADTAMYAAKDRGMPWEIYTPALDRGRSERLALLSDLRRAVAADELHLHYQPKMDLRSGLITSVEALVRWTHPTLGPLGPDVFIPLAESTGLIEELTAVVLDNALRQCRAWEMQGLNIAVAVNLSARNVNNADLPDQVAEALRRTGVSAAHLILEITESSVMGDPERTVPTLNRLADLGLTLSLDDFGTGYSSLAYLQRLPVREVKIDRSFVLGMGNAREGHASTALVRSIIALGNSLGLRIVAEGVETQDLLEQLAALGCHVVQGYHIGRPVPGADIVAQHGARLGDCVREGVRPSRAI